MEVEIVGGKVIIILSEGETKLLLKAIGIVLISITQDIVKLIENRIREAILGSEACKKEVYK